MALLDLTCGESDDILDGGPPTGQDDADLVHEIAFMRATRDAEPAPPMRVDLVCLIGGDGCCVADG